MPSLHVAANEQVFEELCAEDSEWLTLAAEVLQKLKQGFYGPKAIIDALGQNWMSPSLAEAFAFAQLWRMLWLGEVVVARLAIGREPLADVDVSGNNEALQRLGQTSGVRCSARFWGGLADQDGFVRLEQTVRLIAVNFSDQEVWDGPDGLEYPLEVGYQLWSKTLHVLRTHGKLARWPYGSRDVFLMMVPESVHDRWQASLALKVLGLPENGTEGVGARGAELFPLPRGSQFGYSLLVARS
jgi:hypothetical protein